MKAPLGDKAIGLIRRRGILPLSLQAISEDVIGLSEADRHGRNSDISTIILLYRHL